MSQKHKKKFKPGAIHVNINIDSEFLHNYFQKKNHSYLVVLTGKSTKFVDLIDKESYIISENSIRFGLMRLIKLTKDNVKKNIENKKCQLKESFSSSYFRVNKKMFPLAEGEIKDITEVDLTKAYLESAFRLNMLDEKVYKQLLKITGTSRKICLGSLATKKTHKIYSSKGELISQDVEKDDLLRQAWNNIVSETDRVMNEILYMNNFDFYFYWVDNLFLPIEPCEVKAPENVALKFHEEKSLFYVNSGYNKLWVQMNDFREFNLRST
jgi:hypothetical protein